MPACPGQAFHLRKVIAYLRQIASYLAMTDVGDASTGALFQKRTIYLSICNAPPWFVSSRIRKTISQSLGSCQVNNMITQ